MEENNIHRAQEYIRRIKATFLDSEKDNHDIEKANAWIEQSKLNIAKHKRNIEKCKFLMK